MSTSSQRAVSNAWWGMLMIAIAVVGFVLIGEFWDFLERHELLEPAHVICIATLLLGFFRTLVFGVGPMVKGPGIGSSILFPLSPRIKTRPKPSKAAKDTDTPSKKK